MRGEKVGSIRCTGNMVTKNRNGLSSENVEMVVPLRRPWDKVDQ